MTGKHFSQPQTSLLADLWFMSLQQPINLPQLRNCFSTFLTGLAVCDSAFLFFAILMFGLPNLSTW